MALRDRSGAPEDKFADEQTFQFRVQYCRSKLLCLWAASFIGAADAGAYAQNLVSSTLDGKVAHQIASKIRHDFDVVGVAFPNDGCTSGLRPC